MNNRALISIDVDAIYDPIFHLVMRHPVLASDGRFYEAQVLQDWLSRKASNGLSPITRERITHITYCRFLASALADVDEERFQDYDINAILSQFSFKEEQPVRKIRGMVSLAQGLLLFLGILLFYASRFHEQSNAPARNNNVDLNQVMLLSGLVSFAFGALDYGCRNFSRGHGMVSQAYHAGMGFFAASGGVAPRDEQQIRNVVVL